MRPTVQPPHVYTSTPSAPPPPTIPIVGVTTPMPENTSDDRADKSATVVSGPQEAPQNISKAWLHCPYTSSYISCSFYQPHFFLSNCRGT